MAKEDLRAVMTIEADCMGACGVCAGSVAVDDAGALVCALKKPVDCVLPRLVAALKAEKPNSARYRTLATIATREWIGQAAKSTAPLPE